VIAPSSGCLVAQAVRQSRDRGRNGHRILRRVLTDGRHPGSFQASPFTGWRRRDLGGFLSQSTVTRRRGDGMRRGRGDRGVRGSISTERRGKTTPTLMSPGQKPRARGSRSMPIRRSDASVVKRSDPRSTRADPQNLRDLRAAKAATASREHQRCGCTQVVWVAEVDRTYRAFSLPGGRKASWKSEALA